ncbi:MAG: NYN domain-containing protein [Bacteroidetes bacterium]|nr:NYN domain-containing protein [Bacteroidota bacterium]
MLAKFLSVLFKRHERAALFVDFDNLGPNRKIKLDYVLNNISLKSTIIRKVYIDMTSEWLEISEWYDYFTRHRIEVKPIAPLTARGKNAADIQMVVDAMDLAHRYVGTSMLNHFILVSGDSDFIPLYEKLRKLEIDVTVFSNSSNKGKYIDSICTKTIEFPELRHLEHYLPNSEFILSILQCNSMLFGKIESIKFEESLSYCLMKSLTPNTMDMLKQEVISGNIDQFGDSFELKKEQKNRKLAWSDEVAFWFINCSLSRIDKSYHLPSKAIQNYLLNVFYSFLKKSKIGDEYTIHEYKRAHHSIFNKNQVLMGFLSILSKAKIIMFNSPRNKFVIYETFTFFKEFTTKYHTHIQQTLINVSQDPKYMKMLSKCLHQLKKTAG